MTSWCWSAGLPPVLLRGDEGGDAVHGDGGGLDVEDGSRGGDFKCFNGFSQTSLKRIKYLNSYGAI